VLLLEIKRRKSAADLKRPAPASGYIGTPAGSPERGLGEGQ